MCEVKVKVINKSVHRLPEYKTLMSAGMDLKANITEVWKLNPGERVMVPTGLYIALPEGYEAQVRPRSGLSLKNGIVAILGTIDADYRGEVGVILVNLSNQPYCINPGDRIAQMVVSKVSQVKWDEVRELEEKERGSGGFGSTGI